MVPGLAQNRMLPVIGLNLPASGPQDPATPIVSSSTVHSTSFSLEIRWVHPPEKVEERQFHDVDRVYHPRRAESVLDPVQGKYLHALHERLLQKRLRIDRRKVRLGESHDHSLDFRRTELRSRSSGGR